MHGEQGNISIISEGNFSKFQITSNCQNCVTSFNHILCYVLLIKHPNFGEKFLRETENFNFRNPENLMSVPLMLCSPDKKKAAIFIFIFR